LILCLVVALPAAADPVDDYIQQEMEKQKIPGLSLLIMRNGKISKMKGYGLANVEHQVPVSPDTIFESGSVGKQFTAAAILLLADRGELDLDDALPMYFPTAPSTWHQITIRHLLTMTSGLSEYISEVSDLHQEYTDDELLRKMLQLPIEFEPGTQWSYSNSGYVVLGMLISKLAGEPWGEFVKENIFDALGMKTARVITESAIVPNRAAGYRHDEDGVLLNKRRVSETLLSTGDGAIYFSARDLAAWDRALRDRKLFSRESYEAWWTPVKLQGDITYPYGMGWWANADQRGRSYVHHGGTNPGFRAFIARYLDDDLTVVVLTNVFDTKTRAIAQEVAGIVEPALRLPAMDQIGKDADKARARKILGVLEAWASWRKSDDMGIALAKTLTGSAGETYYRNLTGERLSRMTKFEWLVDDDVSDQGMRRRGEEIARIAYYVLETPDGQFRYRFYLTADDRVVHFMEGEGG
jgi:CubicO group peptidase (beta-lactamase class C family)